MFNFTSRPLYPQERAPGTHWRRRWVGPRDGLDAVVRRKIPNPCRESPPGRPARNLVSILTEIRRLLAGGETNNHILPHIHAKFRQILLYDAFKSSLMS